MTDRERAAALADEVERQLSERATITHGVSAGRLIAHALRAYASPEATISDEMVEEAASAIWEEGGMAGDQDRCDQTIDDLGKSHEVFRYARAALSAPRQDATLPCEVLVAPNTHFGVGVPISTVLSAIDRRRGRDGSDVLISPKHLSTALHQDVAVSAPPEPVYNAVERILDEESAWIARPNNEVTMRIAMAVTIAAMDALEKISDEPVVPAAGAREVVAKAVYDKFEFDEPGGKPPWVPGGNALKQDEARGYADRVLSALTAAGYPLTPVVAGQTVGPGLIAVEAETMRTIRRAAEMSAAIMRDPKRTGRWVGSERVARQFDRLAMLCALTKETGR